jgi:molybdenum cofactor biosynthesis enzyme MoaA
MSNNSTSVYDQKISWLKDNPALCSKPFKNLFLLQGEQGMRAIPCCNWREETNEFGTPFGQLFQDIKQDVQQDKINSQCHVCSHSEKYNSVSERMRDSIDQIDDNFNFSTDVDYHRITIKFSNLCNLACRICSPEFSSLLAQITQQKADAQFVTDITEDSTVWPTVQQYVIDVLNKYRFVEINLTGGESMIQPGLDKFMTFLNSLDHDFSQVIISLTTNCTSLNQHIIDAIPKFKKVSLNFSIDSVGNNYHYVRWPARFEKIQRVLDQAVDLQKNNPGKFDLNINLVIGVSNVFYIDDIAEYWHRWELDNSLDPKLAIMYLHSPEHQAVETIPKRYRKEVKARCQAALQIAQLSENSGWNSFRTFLMGVIDFCDNDVESETRWQEYLTTASDYDRRTKCTMQEFNGRLWEILTPTDQHAYMPAMIDIDR